MARKYKRSQKVQGEARTQQASESRQGTTPAFVRRADEFNPDYSHIIRDLKRIGILAGSFFVILVALSFFLN